jgi:hypothetical protein
MAQRATAGGQCFESRHREVSGEKATQTVRRLVAADLTMVAPTKRDGKLFAHFTAQPAASRKPQMMRHPRVGDRNSSQTAGSHIPNMISVLTWHFKPRRIITGSLVTVPAV